jgi:hypothetical protein
MSKHHHHPHEGHSSGNAPGTGRRGHGPFFYVAGVCILIALICFIIWGAFAGPVATTRANPPAAAASAK